MPYVHIRITDEGVTAAHKAALIEGVTRLLQEECTASPRSPFQLRVSHPDARVGDGNSVRHAFGRHSEETFQAVHEFLSQST